MKSFYKFAELQERFSSLPQGVQIATGVSLGALLLFCSLWGSYRLARRNLKWSIVIFTMLVSLCTSACVYKVFRIEEPLGGLFVLEHQIWRGAAAGGVTTLAICLMMLIVTPILNLIEGRNFIGFVAARHVRAKKSGFLTIISLLSIVGVMISSFALCAVISIMGGFGADLKSKILNNNANIRVESPDSGGFEYWRDMLDNVRTTPGIAAATPVAGGEVMASSSTTTAGVQLRGIETRSFGAVVDVPESMRVGSFDYLDDPVKLRFLPPGTPIGMGGGGELYLKSKSSDYHELEDTEAVPDDIYPGVVLGKELASSLHAYVGDVLTLVSPMGDLGPMGILPRTRKFRVAGIFYTGMYEYDASHAYVKLEAAQELLDLEHFITSVDIKVKKVDEVVSRTQAVRQAIERPELKVRNWMDMNKNLFSALKLEKIATFVILSIAILVASFCIICTLLLMVTEKSKEIAIMKSMGASDRTILRLFMTEGMLIGGVGTFFGVVTGFTSMSSLKGFGIRLDPEVYYIERLPITVDVSDYLLIAVCSFLITTFATMYPARAASQLSPVDGIRYE